MEGLFLSMYLKHLLHVTMLHKHKQIRMLWPKDQRIFVLSDLIFFAFCLSPSHCDSVGGKLACALPLALWLLFRSGHSQCQAWGESSDCRTNSKAWKKNRTSKPLMQHLRRVIVSVTRHISTAVNMLQTGKQGQNSSVLHISMSLMNVVSVVGGEWAIFLPK